MDERDLPRLQRYTDLIRRQTVAEPQVKAPATRRLHPVRPPQTETAFGATLRRMRESRGISQSKLSDRADFDHSYVSRLEGGARMPTREAVDRFSAALNLNTLDAEELMAAGGYLTVTVKLSPSCRATWALDELHRTADQETRDRIEQGLAVLLWAVEGRKA